MEQVESIVRRMISPITRRIRLMLSRAVITAIRTDGSIQLAQMTVFKGETLDGVPHLQPYGFTSVPLPGAYAIVAFQGGDREFGAVLIADDPRHRPTGWLPGETGVWDHLGKFIRLKADGTLHIKAPRIEIDGDDVRMIAKKTYREDVGGHAEQLEVSGANWRRRNWTIGAVFDTQIDNPVEPPEVDDP